MHGVDSVEAPVIHIKTVVMKTGTNLIFISFLSHAATWLMLPAVDYACNS